MLFLSGTPSFEKQYVELFRGREVTTDATGHFVIPKTPQRMVLSIDFTFTLPGEMERSFMQQKYLSPGEDRPANLVRIRPRATSAPEKKPLSVRLADTLKDCELAGIHSLVIVPGPGDLVEPFVGTHFTNPEQPMDSYSYRLAEIDAAEAAKLPDRLEYFKDLPTGARSRDHADRVQQPYHKACPLRADQTDQERGDQPLPRRSVGLARHGRA